MRARCGASAVAIAVAGMAARLFVAIPGLEPAIATTLLIGAARIQCLGGVAAAPLGGALSGAPA